MDKKGLIAEQIPNLLTISRIFLTFIVMYLIVTKSDIRIAISVFAVAALTDWLDGQLARRFNWTSEFGRQADMIADRFLWIGTALAFLISFGLQGFLTWQEGLQLVFIMFREIMAAPFALIGFFSGNALPQARYVAKVNTFVQGFALPALILSVYVKELAFVSWPLAIACGILGFFSAIYYMHDIQEKNTGKKIKKKR